MWALDVWALGVTGSSHAADRRQRAWLADGGVTTLPIVSVGIAEEDSVADGITFVGKDRTDFVFVEHVEGEETEGGSEVYEE